MKLRLLLSLSVLTALSSCGGNAPAATSSAASSQEAEVTIEDAVGRSVTVKPTSIKKVVCIGAGALRLYSYIGDMKLLSGVEDIDNPDKTTMWKNVARPYYMANMELLKTLPSCGKGGPANQSPEPLAILECEPDIIFSEYEDVKVADDLSERTGVPVVTLKVGKKNCFDEALRNTFTFMGKALGKEDRAATLNKYLIDAENDIKKRCENIDEADRPNVYLAGLGNWGQKGLFDTAASYAPFQIANIKNAVDGQVVAQGQQAIQKELFEEIAPNVDKMIIDASGLANIKTYYQEHPDVFDTMKAVSDGEVYLQMPHFAYYANIEVALMDAYYDAFIVYPERFEGFSIEDKSNEITKLFNGKELYDDIKAMGSSFGGFQKIRDLRAFLE